MNFGEKKTQCRLLLGETDSANSYWSDTEIETQLNLSNVRVAADLPTLMTYSELATSANQETYGLPSDFLQLKSVQMFLGANTVDERRQLVILSYDEYEDTVGGNVNMTGEPAYCRVEFGAVATAAGSPPGDLWIYPVPDSNGGNNYTLRLVYYQKPTELTDDLHVSELPEFMHPIVVYHAAWHLSMKSDNQTKISNLAAMYKDAIKEAKLTVLKRDRSGGKFARSAYGTTALVGKRHTVIRRGPLR
jgi:hypothetical protein